MLFNSVEFFLFLLLTFSIYWIIPKEKINARNWLLLIASYFFYGWWDWRFLGLIFFSSMVDFLLGYQLGFSTSESRKKTLLFLSMSINLGLLGFFKYYNFFLDNFVEAFRFFGQEPDASRLEIILPVGISFYTFQTMSYTLDIYRGKITPTKNLLGFLTFVSLFPQLVAGPIERASHLLPQFFQKKVFDYDYAISGSKLIIWGLFKKIVVADNAALLVNGIFSSYEYQSSISLILGSILFSFQIYCDFSGYSDIAIGVSRLFGFDLITNFKFPYLARNIGEHWKRWHISLTSWFRDYLYIPLGGNRKSPSRTYLNVFLVFLVSGFWHGANWTFIVWGTLHGLFYLVYFKYGKKSNDEFSSFSLKSIFQIFLTFSIASLAFIFFRSESLLDSILYLKGMILNSGSGNFATSSSRLALITGITLLSCIILMGQEVYSSKKQSSEIPFRPWSLLVVTLMIFFMGAFKNHIDFVYFQF